MKEIQIEKNSKLAEILEEIKNSPDAEIVITGSSSEIIKSSLNAEIIKTAGENFGKKVTVRSDDQISPHPTQATSDQKPIEKNNLGFVEGKDVAEETIGKPSTEEAQSKTPVTVAAKKMSRLKKFLTFKGPKWAYALIGFLGVLIIAGFSLFWFLPSASITLFTEPQFKEAEISLIASDVMETVDKEEGIIPLKTLETDGDDSIEAQASGSKTTGTVAKGRVKIVNRDSSKGKTFFKGTVMVPTSGTKLQFTLDKSASISAAPVGCEDDCPQVGVGVTAKDIGDPGNLKSGTVFKVGDASVNLVFAKSETNFSGGSSKKITIVSAADHKKAKEDLLKKLEEKAKTALENENDGVVIPSGGLENKISQQVYSNGVGEETETFRLSMQVKFTAVYFSEADLKEFLVEAVSEELPDDFRLDEENMSIDSESLGKEGGELKIIGKVKAPLIPIIDENEIRKNVSGKSFSSVDSYLKSLNSISGFDIKVSPLPFRFFGRLPFSEDKISVEVVQGE